MKKNLIMGSVWGGWFPGLEVFVSSLSSSGYKGDLVLFVDGMSNDEVRRLTSLGIQVERVPFAVSGQARRYQVWYSYLDKHPGYGNVMLTDVLDVAFQRDPFTMGLGDDEMFTFCQAQMLDGPEFDWLGKSYGEEMRERAMDCHISTPGVVIGSFRRIADYLVLMARSQREVRSNVGNLSVGIHNYLILSGLLPYVRVFDNYQGPVLNLNGVEHTLGEGGVLVNGAGGTAFVVHQWDREGLDEYMISRNRLPETVMGG